MVECNWKSMATVNTLKADILLKLNLFKESLDTIAMTGAYLEIAGIPITDDYKQLKEEILQSTKKNIKTIKLRSLSEYNKSFNESKGESPGPNALKVTEKHPINKGINISKDVKTPVKLTSINANFSTNKGKITTQKSISKPNKQLSALEKSSKNFRSDWYQTQSDVNVSLFIKQAPKDKTKVLFEEQSVRVEFPLDSGDVFSHSIDLKEPIDPNASKFNVFGTKIELILKKTERINWTTLKSNAVKDTNSGPDVKTYPSTSKKDWNKIASQYNDEIKEDNQSSMDFFKEVYADADDDTKRAMMKSYVESKGTALSTDWKQVGSQKVEVESPVK